MIKSGIRNSKAEVRRPWGLVVGLLTASYVTLIGILSGLEPEIILQRAVCASLVMGCLAAATALSFELLTDTRKTRSRRRPRRAH